MQPVDECTGLEGKQKANGDGSTLANFSVFNNLKITNNISDINQNKDLQYQCKVRPALRL